MNAVEGFPPEPVTIGWNRRWTAMAAVASMAMVGLSGWFAQAILFKGFGDLTASGHLMLGIFFGVFALLFVGVAITYALASFDSAPVIIINESGVHDRRLSSAVVAWADIDTLTPMQHGGQLMLALGVKQPRRQPLPRNPLWLVNRLSARMLGRQELAVKLVGISATPRAVYASIQAWATHVAPSDE